MKEMYYYVQNGEYFEKYLLSFDVNELTKLRDEMIEKCSRIVPNQIGELNHIMKDFPDRKLTNLKDLGISRIVSRGTEPDVTYHKYSYTIYYYPEEVILINELLKGNAQVYHNIKFKEKIDYEKLINEKDEKINAIANRKTVTKMAALQDLDTLINESNASKNQLGTIAYQERFEKIVNLKLLKQIKVSDIKEVLNFFNSDEIDIGLEYEDKTLVYKPNRKS